VIGDAYLVDTFADGGGNRFEIGVRRIRDRIEGPPVRYENVARLDHFMPVATADYTMSQAVLECIKTLFS